MWSAGQGRKAGTKPERRPIRHVDEDAVCLPAQILWLCDPGRLEEGQTEHPGSVDKLEPSDRMFPGSHIHCATFPPPPPMDTNVPTVA